MKNEAKRIVFNANEFPVVVIGELYTYFLKKGVDKLKLVYYADEIEQEFSEFIMEKGKNDIGKFFIAKFNNETVKILDNQIMPIFGTIDLYIFGKNSTEIIFNETSNFDIKHITAVEFEEIKKIFFKHAVFKIEETTKNTFYFFTR